MSFSSIVGTVYAGAQSALTTYVAPAATAAGSALSSVASATAQTVSSVASQALPYIQAAGTAAYSALPAKATLISAGKATLGFTTSITFAAIATALTIAGIAYVLYSSRAQATPEVESKSWLQGQWRVFQGESAVKAYIAWKGDKAKAQTINALTRGEMVFVKKNNPEAKKGRLILNNDELIANIAQLSTR